MGEAAAVVGLEPVVLEPMVVQRPGVPRPVARERAARLPKRVVPVAAPWRERAVALAAVGPRVRPAAVPVAGGAQPADRLEDAAEPQGPPAAAQTVAVAVRGLVAPWAAAAAREQVAPVALSAGPAVRIAAWE